MKKRKKRKCRCPFFNEDDLRAWILDEEIFSVFKLREKEKQILVMHNVKGYTFKIIGPVYNFSRQRAQEIHADSLIKIKKQAMEILRQYKRKGSSK